MYIYLYIIYNIIKIKKRTYPQGYTHTEEKTDTQPKVAGCVFCKNRFYSMLWLGFWAQPATCNSATLVSFGLQGIQSKWW